MSEFKAGDKVTVKSFEATVIGWNIGISALQVEDREGSYHYIFDNQIKKPLPYVAGALYVDADDDVFRFHAATDDKEPYWTIGGNERGFNYPTRPLRAIGDNIQE